MNLIFCVLLCLAGLALVVRILDSRSWGLALALFALPVLLVGTWIAARATAEPLTATVVSDAEEQPLAATPVDTTPAEKPATVAPAEAPPVETTATEAPPVEAPPAGTDDPVIQLDGEKPVIPPRPAWVEAEPVRTGDVQTQAVASGPHEHLRECQAALDQELQKATAAYIDEYLGRVHGDRFKASQFVTYTAKDIRSRFVRPENLYEEKLTFSFGPMYQVHALLAFGPDFRDELDGRRAELDRQWKQVVVSGRLVGAGLVFGVILALLTVVFGYFRLDTATRGYYTGRLRLLAAAAILAVVFVGMLLVRKAPWM